jgi:fatty acid desaturase
MTATLTARNYSLTGPETQKAIASGLAEATWYQSPISRKRLKELCQRSNGPAIRDTLIWFAAFAVSGYFGWYFWGTWWCVPFFFVYGTLWGSSSDSRWHEAGHRTAFKSVWMNDVVYYIACFMVLREPTLWRWSHARHHTDTIIVGRDPEIASPRPVVIARIILSFFQIPGGIKYFGKLIRHSLGRIEPDVATFVPENEHRKLFWTARLFLVLYAIPVALAIWMQSILPLMYAILPSFYGAWLMVVFGLTQHAGLAEDVLDHRLNCRTVHMNPVFRFLYWNMGYHVEHHMFPMVPFHSVRGLHEEIKADLPTPYSGLIAAYREIIPTLWRQAKDPSYYVKRPLPTPATQPTVEPQPA